MTQCQMIIEYIDMFGSITTMEAFSDLGITRLASRISDLKKQGYDFEDEMEVKKNRYGKKVAYKRYWRKENGQAM